MTQLLTVTKHGRVGAIALKNPPVNALSHPLRAGLLEALSNLFADTAVQAVAIWCEGRTFIAGADIREFGKPPLAPDVPELVEFIESAPKPVIVAIHGTALGGGLELALACHFRIAAADSKLGLPEVTLGILPGAGGTQRLPRLIGVRAALDMIVRGQPVSAPRALTLGLIDETFVGDSKTAALTFAESVIERQPVARRVSGLTARLEDPNVFAEYQEKLAQECRGFLAPFHCVRAIQAAVELPFSEGLKREHELFLELMASSESKAQRHVFFAEREVAKVPGLPEDTPTRPVESVAVIGAGPNAAELVRCFVEARLPVTLLANTGDELDRCLAAIREHYASAVARGKCGPTEAHDRLGRIQPALSYEDLRSADLLIEAVAENLDVKRGVFTQLDAVGKSSAIFATSTSSVDVDAVAGATRRPEVVVGMHFATPLDTKKLLENVQGQRTRPDVLATVMKLGKALGKVAVPVRGLVADRLLARGSREVLLLLEEGALPEQVHQALYDFGFPASPFARLGLAGLHADFEDRRTRRAGRRELGADEIRERCLYAVIDEGARALEDGAALRPLDIDLIWVKGYDFPIYRGGPMFFADQVGLRSIHHAILKYKKQVGEEYWTPAPLIERLAEEGRGFYPQAR